MLNCDGFCVNTVCPLCHPETSEYKIRMGSHEHLDYIFRKLTRENRTLQQQLAQRDEEVKRLKDQLYFAFSDFQALKNWQSEIILECLSDPDERKQELEHAMMDTVRHRFNVLGEFLKVKPVKPPTGKEMAAAINDLIDEYGPLDIKPEGKVLVDRDDIKWMLNILEDNSIERHFKLCDEPYRGKECSCQMPDLLDKLEAILEGG